MTPTNPDVENALLAAAGALPGHFSDSADLTIEALTAIQATTLSLPGGAFAVESIVKGHDHVGTVVLIITGLVDHAKGEVFSRDEARTLWSAALTEVLTPLADEVGGFTPGQVHMTDAFDALDNADEAQVVGVFRGQTLAGLLLNLPATATGQGAAAAVAAALAAATGQDDLADADADSDAAGSSDIDAAETADSDTAAPADMPQPAVPPAASAVQGVTDEVFAAQAAAAAGAATAAGAAAATGAAPAAASAAPGPVLAPSPLQPLTGPVTFSADLRRIELLRDVMMGVSVELGRARLSVQDILGLIPGSIVELDRPAGAPVDVLVNGKLIAHGEVVVVDEEFAVRISEVVSPERDGRVSA